MRQPTTHRVDVGDAELAVHEWTGDGDPILLLHATGFHSRCWDQVIAGLATRHVYAADLRYHGDSDAQGEPNWLSMSQDIQAVVTALDLNRLTGVGHSIGGYITARVAAWEPQRFNRLLLIDPVIVSPERAAATREMRADSRASDHPVSRRKNDWRSTDEMFERFVDREPFNTWKPAVLKDYCEHGLRPAENGFLQLACHPLDEAAIYWSSADNDRIYEELASLQLPVTVLRAPSGETRGDFSQSPTWTQLAEVLPNGTDVLLPDMNHFIPMQDPELVARHILG